MEENSESGFEEFEQVKIVRRKLLPWWIKVFCWIFMIMGLIGVVSAPVGLLGYTFNLSIYGFETSQPISLMGILILIIMGFKGITAYYLWSEDDNAIGLAKIDAIFGIVLCVIAMFIMPFVLKTSSFSFRLEILFLVLYYRKINNIEYTWDNLEEQ